MALTEPPMPVLDVIAWVLLFIWASLFAGGLFFGRKRPRRPLLPHKIQIASALVLLLLPWYGFLLTRPGAEDARYASGIAASITLSLLGGQLARRSRPRLSVVGIAAIAVGYLLYAVAVAQYGATLESVRLLFLSLGLLVGAAAAGAVLLRTRRQSPVQAWTAAAFALLLSAATGLAVGLALTGPRFGVLAAGALLLVSGDLLLLLELAPSLSFSPRSRPAAQKNRHGLPSSSDDAAQLLRAPGQALIAVSIWAALQDPTSLQFPLLA